MSSIIMNFGWNDIQNPSVFVTTMDECCYWVLIEQIAEKLIKYGEPFTLDARLKSFLSLARHSGIMEFGRLPDCCVEIVLDILKNLLISGHNEGGIDWKAVGPWGLKYSKPSNLKIDSLRQRLGEIELEVILQIEQMLNRRKSWRCSFPFRSRLIRVLAQRVRDSMEEELGWPDYGTLALWVKRNGLSEHKSLFSDYRVPGRVNRCY